MPRYKILVGRYSEGKKVVAKDANGNEIFKPVTYVAGDVFDSNKNLLRFNAPGFPPKFEVVSAATPIGLSTSSTDDTLSSMTVAELRTHAAENEIDLGGAKTKEDILSKIRAAE